MHDDDAKEVKADIKEIKADVQKVHVELARYNGLLDVHIQATRNLESRVKPIETHVEFVRKLLDGCKWVLGFLAALFAVIKYLFK